MKKITPLKNLVLISFLIINTHLFAQSAQNKFSGKTIDLTSSDGLTVKADVYESGDKTSPFILLFHQAGFSRGEYRQIAPKLVDLGFSCIAIDQRSGKAVNDVVNETHLDAVKKMLPSNYADAYPDLVCAYTYVKENYPGRKIIVWGSSYSASLVFVMGQKYKKQIAGIVSFSPGEYFKFEDKEIKDFAKEITCPIWISSAKKEQSAWKTIYESIPGQDKSFYLPETDGYHGSRALWESNKGHEKCWESLTEFLSSLK